MIRMTAIAAALCLVLIQVAGVTIESFQAKPVWRPAMYRTLIVGQSKVADLLRVFGKPKWSGPEADRDPTDPDPPLYYQYQNGGEFPGVFAVIVGEKSKKIIEIRNSPDKLTKNEAIRHFGHQYLERRYSLCPDIDDTAAPVYEDRFGDLLQIEYPEKGIILSVNEENNIDEISYVSKNLALSSLGECKKLTSKRLRKSP